MKKLAIVILAVVSTSAFAMGPGHKGGERMARAHAEATGA